MTEEIKKDLKVPVYLVSCKWCVDEILDFFEKMEGIKNHDNFVRVVYNREGETKMSVAMISDELYEILNRKGFTSIKNKHELKIFPYKLRNMDLPSENHGPNLFVPVPRSLSNDKNLVIRIIEEKLKMIAKWGIIPEGSWKINPILFSRETGYIKGGTFIIFNSEVELERIAYARIVMTDTWWEDLEDPEERERFRCSWAIKRKNKEEEEKREQQVKKLPPKSTRK